MYIYVCIYRSRFKWGMSGGLCRHAFTRRYSVYLLYWYKSTNIDAAAAGASTSTRSLTYAHVCSRMLTYAHACSRMLMLPT